jgi:hypothetical protein
MSQDDLDEGAPVYTPLELEELDAQDDADDLLHERCKQP